MIFLSWLANVAYIPPQKCTTNVPLNGPGISAAKEGGRKKLTNVWVSSDGIPAWSRSEKLKCWDPLFETATHISIESSNPRTLTS